jgi:hypothetical protein
MSWKCMLFIWYIYMTYYGHYPDIQMSKICSKMWSFPDVYFVQNTSSSCISRIYHFTRQFTDIFRIVSWYFRDIIFFFRTISYIFRTFSGRNLSLNAGQNISLNAGRNLSLNAGWNLSLNAGQNLSQRGPQYIT